jgi:DNA-binding transcriptional LysR family regulator
MVFGRLHVLPVAAAFLELHPEVDIQLRLGDRNVNLIEEHVDVALRIGALPDSNLIAAAEAGLGLTRVLSYQVAEALHEGRLVRVLAGAEPPAVPANVLYPGQGDCR